MATPCRGSRAPVGHELSPCPVCGREDLIPNYPPESGDGYVVRAHNRDRVKRALRVLLDALVPW